MTDDAKVSVVQDGSMIRGHFTFQVQGTPAPIRVSSSHHTRITPDRLEVGLIKPEGEPWRARTTRIHGYILNDDGTLAGMRKYHDSYSDIGTGEWPRQWDPVPQWVLDAVRDLVDGLNEQDDLARGL